MTRFLALPIVLPLLAAGLSMAFYNHPRVQRAIGVVVLTACTAIAAVLLAEVTSDGPVVTHIGNWPAPIGISLVADTFSAMLLLVSTVMLLAVLLYAIGSPSTTDTSRFFHPVYLVLAAGVSAAFLTGDLFNLFVAFELMLSASFVLITLSATREQVRSAMSYVVISLVASVFFVAAVAFVYAATGTVNMAELAGRLDDIPGGVRDGLGLLLLVVFGVKAAIFPLYFWLPDSYPTAPTPVTAIFAGLLTKVGVYAIIRSQTLLFPSEDGGASVVLLVIAAATMLVGVLGAIAQEDVKRILSFHIVSQIGYMIFGVALFTVAGVAAAIFYMVHHIIVKTALFLVAGLIEEAGGTGALRRLSGLSHSAPVVALLFAVPALSLAGLPPFSGFVAKLGLVEAGLDAGAALVVGVSLLVSLLTLFSMTKIWGGVFWGAVPSGDDGPSEVVRHRSPWLMVLPTGVLAAASIAVALAAGPLYSMSEDAAEELMDRAQYIDAQFEAETAAADEGAAP